MKISVLSVLSIFFIPMAYSQDVNYHTLTTTATDLNSQTSIRITGLNSPVGEASARNISFDFSSAGKARIQAYRNNSMGTTLQFLTNDDGDALGGEPSVRMQISRNGNVGIGTTNPAAKLHISQSNQEIRFDYNGTNDHYGSLRWAALQLGNNGTNRIVAGRTVPGGLLDFYVNNTNDGSNYNIGPNGILAMRINPEGKVGIGTTSPFSQLHVKGAFAKNEYGIINTALSVYSSEPANIGAGGAIALGGNSGNSSLIFPFAYIMGGKESNLSDNYAGYFAINTVSPGGNGEANSGNYERLRITSIGNVGIGTETPREKLSVNGKIRAQEIKVEASPWPDYVFNKSYSLPTLLETEQHIKEKGQLPGIPSAAEVKANGIDLGDMNAKLLQKIEELTLHLINLNNTVNELKNEVNLLKKK